MACSKHVSLDYEKECFSLKKIISKERFPIVARTNTTVNNVHDGDQFGIPEGTQLLLQRLCKTRYARIKVLNFHDNDKTRTENGCDFVLKHDSYVGKEFLIPLKYPCMFKFVQRPGSQGRYTSISQVLNDPPPLLMVSEDTEALITKNLDESVIVPKGTVLEPKRKFRLGTESLPFLECWDGRKSCSFRTNATVNFMAVEKLSIHTLFELSKNQLLPKVIRFEHIKPEDIVLKDEELRNALISILEGPIEVNGFVDGEFLVCSAEQEELQTYEIALIPNSLWDTIYAQRHCFLDENEKQIYIKKDTRNLLALNYIDKCLYIMYDNQCQITWLQTSDVLNQTGMCVSDAVVSSDENSNSVDDPKRISSPTSKTGKNKSVVQVLKGKAQHAFNKLQKPFLKHTKRTEKNHGNENYFTTFLSQDDDEKEKEYTSLSLPYNEIMTDKTLQNTRSDRHTNNTRYSVFPTSNKGNQDRTHQTKKDFYTFTISELVEYFKTCGMGQFAIHCGSNNLDGAFFQNFDLNELKAEPFCLNEIEVVNVKRVIEERSGHN